MSNEVLEEARRESVDNVAEKVLAEPARAERTAYREPERRFYPAGKREIVFALGILAVSLFLANVTAFGGFNLGFAIAVIVCVLCSSAYLIASGRKMTVYSGVLLVLSIVIAASFARSDDGFVKFVMVCFLLVSVNLGLCLLAGKNRRDPGSAGTLADAGYTLFSLGFSEMGSAAYGLKTSLKKSGTVGQKSMAILAGLGIAVPVLLVIIPLLMKADAAFEGLLNKLPKISFGEIVVTAFLGVGAACVLYSRGVALQSGETAELVTRKRKGLAPLTVNTVLGAVGVVYSVYLFSQLAYFTGGLAGILPEEYTLAQYARRGFFEMAALCAVNLSIILFGLWIVRREEGAPLSTRLFSLFLCVVTLFFVVAASGKMVMYIDSYGLTRLRLLTQIIMIYMGIVTVLVSIHLFVPKLPYMKVVILSALVIGAATAWADVDTMVAKYNVDAYLSGRMETVDVDYLNRLGDGAVPQIARLLEEAGNADVAETAKTALENRDADIPEDFRGWNYADAVATEYVRKPEKEESLFSVSLWGGAFNFMHAKEIATYSSPDGEYSLVFEQMGDPKWPFGPTDVGLTLKNQDGKIIERVSTQLSNDGANAGEQNIASISWSDDAVIVILTASEMKDKQVTIAYNKS